MGVLYLLGGRLFLGFWAVLYIFRERVWWLDVDEYGRYLYGENWLSFSDERFKCQYKFGIVQCMCGRFDFVMLSSDD